MPPVAPGSKILVSGANGFIAVWVVRDFLEKGYSVRGTVRSEAKSGHIRQLFQKYGDKLEIVVVPDITQAGAFDAAVKGIDAIAHTASPFHFKAGDPNELIVPAVNGTVGILESALKHAPEVKRIVVLSSCASVFNAAETGVYDETRWNTESPKEVEDKGSDASQAAKYRTSKTLAEKAAWEFVEKNKNNIKWDLVTLCPPFVFGPILHEVASPSELNTSMHDLYENLVSGAKTPEQVEGVQGSWIDVRDVAAAHVKALEVEQAGGERFIISSGNFIWQDWYDTTNKLGVPGLKTPKGTPGRGADVKHRQVYNTKKARSVLGLQFRDMATTAKDSVEDLKAKGW